MLWGPNSRRGKCHEVNIYKQGHFFPSVRLVKYVIFTFGPLSRRYRPSDSQPYAEREAEYECSFPSHWMELYDCDQQIIDNNDDDGGVMPKAGWRPSRATQ